MWIEAASKSTVEATLADGNPVRPLWGKPQAQLDALLGCNDVEFFDFISRLDDAFGQAEADGEVFEIGRRREHDGVGRAVIAECYWRLFGDCTSAVRHRIAMEGGARNATDWRRNHRGLASQASG